MNRLLLLPILVLIAGCMTSEQQAKPNPVETSSVEIQTGPTGVKIAGFDQEIMENGQASHIEVQHILIGFEGSVPGKPITRTKEEAAAFAAELLKKAQGGADFDALVAENTDDSAPGIYKMANHGAQGDMAAQNPDEMVFPRAGMVPAFGDVGFPLAVGEIGMSQHDPATSKYGWHIIKRLR